MPPTRKKADDRAALRHAQGAVKLAPEMANAHFSAAVIADMMCVPNAQPGPNMTQCNLAIEEYKRALQIDASQEEATKDLAYLLWQFGRDESEVYYRRTLSLDPRDPEVLAAICAMDFRRSWGELTQRKTDAGVPLKKPLIGLSSCFEVRQRNLDRVNEGISFLTKATQARTDNTDFMVWLSDLYKIRAEIQCGNPPAYRDDMNEAGHWDRLKNAGRRTEGGHALWRYPAPPPPDHSE